MPYPDHFNLFIRDVISNAVLVQFIRSKSLVIIFPVFIGRVLLRIFNQFLIEASILLFTFSAFCNEPLLM